MRHRAQRPCRSGHNPRQDQRLAGPDRHPGRSGPRPAVRMFRLRAAVAAALAVAAAALTACSGPSQGPGPATYYLALGDSLSQGVQPDAAGASTETTQGYPDLVYAQLRRGHPTLKLVQLGCPGETTKTMIHGGICRYPGGSQLAAAVAFLHAHRGHVLLVTIDIGANDPEDCGSQPEPGQTRLLHRAGPRRSRQPDHDPGHPPRRGRARRPHRRDELLPARTRRMAQRHARPGARLGQRAARHRLQRHA